MQFRSVVRRCCSYSPPTERIGEEAEAEPAKVGGRPIGGEVQLEFLDRVKGLEALKLVERVQHPE